MVVVDTHTLIWWVSGDCDQLSPAALAAIEVELKGGDIIVSSITAWEIAMLVQKGRITLTMDVAEWLAVVERIEGVHFMSVDNEIGVKSTELPGEFHKDSADRIIVATARKLAVPVVSADEKIRAYAHVHTIW
ncbi:type II toxin-antitoxin system VapC family toxin [Andreprevotia chitinilytica]|uniref:type II toxin-antitoxin system VapC family toxin n=1 Tax=Andreprevotia chitinilytica TaxID=396808 RepID=UPI000550B66A|nr:type II toxin-antitoxin system VapC family toxin [Andreprevotia chitinilytica]